MRHAGHYHRGFALTNTSTNFKKLTSKPIEEFLNRIKDGGKLNDWAHTSLWGPLASSKNPLVTGSTLSLEFARDAKTASKGDRQYLLSLQQSVDNLLLDVLAQLPQTVRGFYGGMDGCSALLEAKLSKEGSSPRDVSPSSVPGETSTRSSIDKPTPSATSTGQDKPDTDHDRENETPLQMMLGNRQKRQTFCTAPLVMEYVSRKFYLGLPTMKDASGVLGDWDELQDLADESLVVGCSLPFTKRRQEQPLLKEKYNSRLLLGKGHLLDHVLDPVVLLQGANADLPGLAGIPILGGFPGLQFIVAGIVAEPSHYYGVPVIRMAFEFFVYVAMLAIFSTSVLFHSDGPLTPGEVVFFISFVAVSLVDFVCEKNKGKVKAKFIWDTVWC